LQKVNYLVANFKLKKSLFGCQFQLAYSEVNYD